MLYKDSLCLCILRKTNIYYNPKRQKIPNRNSVFVSLL